jgi:glutathione S-transferase
MTRDSNTYDLWYWDGIPGRGEFVRLALEAAGIPYRDRARAKNGDNAMVADMKGPHDHPPFAPPYLVADGMTIGQTANILVYLGAKHGLAPEDVEGRLWVNQLQLTIADMVVEVHDVHHPVSASQYYEDQKEEAARRAQSFRDERIPKFLAYFERVLERHGKWLAGGAQWTYADLSLYQLVDGLLFAFPKRMATVARKYTKVMALHERVATLEVLQAYLSSERRLPYGDGIFRHYPELDAA